MWLFLIGGVLAEFHHFCLKYKLSGQGGLTPKSTNLFYDWILQYLFSCAIKAQVQLNRITKPSICLSEIMKNYKERQEIASYFAQYLQIFKILNFELQMFMGILETSEQSKTWNKGSMGHLFWDFFYDPYTSNYASSCPRYQQFGNLPRDDDRHLCMRVKNEIPV